MSAGASRALRCAPLHRAVRSLHRITSPAAKVEAKPDDRGETIVLRILEPRTASSFSSFPPPPAFLFLVVLLLIPRCGTDSAARPPHNRDKLRGWKAERGSAAGRRRERNSRPRRETAGAARFAHNFHVSGAGLVAVSLRENKVSLRSGARESTRVALRCIALRETPETRRGRKRAKEKERGRHRE